MIRIGTAEDNSTFLMQGRALAAHLQCKTALGPFEVLTSPAASIDNANRLQRGEIDLGFMAANWIGPARRGEAPFTTAIDLKLVAPMNLGPLFFIARADSSIKRFDDLAGKRVAVGPTKSGMAQHARTMLAALGRATDWFEAVHLGFAEGAEALRTKRIDAQLQCPIPNPVMTALDQSTALRVIEHDEKQLERLLAGVPFYRRAIMAKGQLRALEADSAQPGVLNVLVCHAGADAGCIADIAAAIASGARDLGAADALFESLDAQMISYRNGTADAEIDGVGLHEGARRAYGWR